MRPRRTRRLSAAVRPATVVLVLGLLVSMAVPMYLLNDNASYQGAIIGGLPSPSSGDKLPDDLTTPSGDTPPVVPHDSYEDFEIGAPSETLEVEVGESRYEVRSDEYSITVAQDGNYVDYVIKPYFTDDVIRYRRINPNVAPEGTVDQYGNDLNWVSMKISNHGRDGNKVWFVESCPQFSMRQEFTIYRDYFELDTTYIPGEKNAVVSYFVGLYDENGGMIDLFSDGKVHRYVPGFEEDRPASHGIGGWYPSYMMYAPSFDLRTPRGDLGLEWGYSDEEAYLWAPVWMKDFGGGGPSTFCLKFSSKSSVLPDPAKGEETTYHMFVRPYKHSDGEPIGHNYGYAKWVAYEIAEKWQVHGTPIFPLTLTTLSTWDQTLLDWAEGSQISVAMQSTDPDQIDYHYKSAQLMEPHDAPMPAEWQLHDAPGRQMYSPSGYRIASAASEGYRDHLINGDPYNDWWWSSDGVFWDEINVVDEANNIRNDYNYKDDFVYTGFLKLAEETYASGKFDYVIMNPFTALLHLSLVADLTMIEGYEAVPMYNNDLKAHTHSVMNFVNNMPEELRPRISVDQNYAAGDKWAVYSVLFGAAKYGFYPNLRNYDPGSVQIPNMEMAEKMFLAMGADRHHDPAFWPATLDLRTDGSSITTDRPMVVMTGDGTPSIEFTGNSDRYSLTNLWGSSKSFTVVLPTPGVYDLEGLEQIGEVRYTADGKAVVTGTIAAEATGHIVKRSDVAASHAGEGEAFVEPVDGSEIRVRATGGETTLYFGGLTADRSYEVFCDGVRVALIRADDNGWTSYTRAYGADEETITVSEAADSVLPQVISTSPANGSLSIPITTNITVVLSEPVDHAAFEAAFALRGDGAINGTFTWTDNSTAVFVPSEVLEHDRNYTIEVGDLIDSTGNVNSTVYAAEFRTELPEARFTLVAHVLDADGDPVESAYVELTGTGLNATTGADGNASFAPLKAGTYEVMVERDGYRPARFDATIGSESIIANITLEKSIRPQTAAMADRPALGLEFPLALTAAALLLVGLMVTGKASVIVRTAVGSLSRLGRSLGRLRRP